MAAPKLNRFLWTLAILLLGPTEPRPRNLATLGQTAQRLESPLSAALADLRRAAPFLRILLRGLTPDEVRRMLDNIAGQIR